MILGVLDIVALSPDFANAVTNIHNVTISVAFVVVLLGLGMTAIRAQSERSLASIWPAMMHVVLVALFLSNLPMIGNWIESVVLGIEQASGVTGNPFIAYLDALKQKYGVDLSALKNLAPAGPYGSAGASQDPGPITISNYGYADDPNPDPNSAQGSGIGPFSAPGSLVPGQSLALSPSLTAGLTPGQQVTVTLATGQTITGIYADRTAQTYNGQTLRRVDIYDPNHQYDSLSGATVANIQGGQMANNNNNPVGSFFGGLLHPVEAAQATMFGTAVLLLSEISVFIWWIVALLQSVLWYSEIAIAPLFVGFILVRGYENIAKTFILSFAAISLWPIALLIMGLGTQFIISMALNTSNNDGIGAANVAGISYMWLVGLALWVGVGSIAGPWLISKLVVSGASGMADMVVGSRNSAVSMARMGSSAAAGAVGSLDGSVPFRPMPSFSPNYARRPKS